ncbi:hypothetical protein D3C72_874580 [compost metagenome]
MPGAATDLRVVERREQMAEGVGGPLVVGVGEHQDRAAADRDPGIERRRLALAGQIEHGDARVLDPVRAGHCVIGRAVAGEDDLQRAGLIILGQHGAQFFFDMPRFVVRGNHDAHVHRLCRSLARCRVKRCQQRQ